MLDAFFIKKVFYFSVIELGAVVTSNLLDLGIKLILCPLQELLEHLLSFTLILQKEHPNKMRIIINNEKIIFVIVYAYVGDRTKHVHVKQFQGSYHSHDVLSMVMCSNLLPGMECSARPILLKNNIG
jgi:hypothetical protein